MALREYEIESIGPNAKAVREVHSSTNDAMRAKVDSLHGTVASGYEGETAPTCYRVGAVGHFYRTGEARVVAYYKTRTWPEWLMANVNKGIVFTTPAQTSQTPSRDLDDQLIEGQGEDTGDDIVWRIKTGENFNILPKENVIVRAIVDSEATYIDPFDSLLGQVNESSLPNLGDDEGGHLLYLGKSKTPILDDGPLWEIEYHFLRHHLKWNEQLITESLEMIRKKFLNLTEGPDWISAGGFSYKWMYYPTGDTRTHVNFLTTDAFSTINDMLS